MSLLEQAQAIKIKRKKEGVNDEVLELSVAYLSGNLSLAQASQVVGKSESNFSSFVGSIIKRGIKEGKIKIEIIG